MGKARRERMEQLRKKETRVRRIKAGAAGIVLTAAGIFGYSQLNDGGEVPARVAQLINDAPSDSSNEIFQEILDHKYNEVASREIGDIKVTIAEIDNTKVDAEKVLGMYSLLNTYLKTNPGAYKHRIIGTDAQGKPIKMLDFQAQPIAVNKNITVFFTPFKISFGNSATESRGSEVISHVDLNTPEDFAPAITEACQGMVDIKPLNHDPNPLIAKQETLRLQEQFCNSLSRAFRDSLQKIGFEDYTYNQLESPDRNLNDEPNYRYMPYIGERSVFEAFPAQIPTNFGSSLVYPGEKLLG